MQTLNQHWLKRLEQLDFAFQPIVNIHTAVCYGYEALLRNHQKNGFESIGSIFDEAYEKGILHKVDLFLRKKAFTKYAKIPWCNKTKLFYNLDNRLFNSPDYCAGFTENFLRELSLSNDNIFFEISERHELEDKQETVNTLEAYRRQGFKIAVDDCGTGFSGFQLLYYTEPDCIKIDRFFIKDIESDAKKRLFAASIVEVAHLMGDIVVAEGVETCQEYYSCRKIGCDLVQGYFVQKPQLNIDYLQQIYPSIELLGKSELRNKKKLDKTLVKSEIVYIEPINVETSIVQIFEAFLTKKDTIFFPVINTNNEIVGIIKEAAFKNFAYSRFGRQLLENPNFVGNIYNYITRYPVADVNAPIEKILQIAAQNDSSEGIIILEGLSYIGFLSTMSLLKIINEKSLYIAREQNPLTKLPGNTLIYEYISNMISDRKKTCCFIYFDLDNFKAYNDTYGFRNGDRIILLFAGLLRSEKKSGQQFIGHIGGDDFFMGIEDTRLDVVIETTKRLSSQFKKDAESFYDTKARQQGYIIAQNRDNNKQQTPLLTVSTVILELPRAIIQITNAEDIGNIIAKLKKKAKLSPDKLCIAKI